MSNRRKIDLDAARRAQAELTPGQDPPVVTIGGKDYVLPVKMPAAVIVGLARARRRDVGGFEEALRALFGPATPDEAVAAGALPEKHAPADLEKIDLVRIRLDEILSAGLELDDLDLIIEGAYGDEEDAEAVTAGE